MRGRNPKWWLVFLLIILSILVGNLIGEALQAALPILGRYSSIGFAPQEINFFDFARLTIGFTLQVNLMGALGALLALFGQQRFL